MNEHYESELATRAHEAKLQAYYIAEDAERERMRPFYLLRPKVFPDGDQWCVLYGENIQEGVCAFGDTPAKAATQFDVEWLNGKAGIKMHNVEFSGTPAASSPEAPLERRVGGAVPPAPTFGGSET